MRSTIVAVALVALGCSAPAIPDGRYRCAADGDCPPGMRCRDGLCYGSGGDAGVSCTRLADCIDPDDCTDDHCVDGLCTHDRRAGCCNDVGDCDDGDACTMDACNLGVCEHPAAPGCCRSAAECDDGDDCTTDTCGKDGACAHDPVIECCSVDADCTDDGNACTVEVCDRAGHTCASSRISECCIDGAAFCDDGIACTLDSCDGVSCSHAPGDCPCTTDVDCDDGNPCTAERCVADDCTYPAVTGCCRTAADCSDGNPCTTDTCSVDMCTSTDIPGCCAADANCEDGNACTDNRCNTMTATCFFPPAICVDSNPCTDDRCLPGTGCAYEPNTSPCNDGVFCTGTDSCSGGGCNVHEGPPCSPGEGCDEAGRTCSPCSCDDDNPCTDDVCTPGGGCDHPPVAVGTSCSGLLTCVSEGICTGGVCSATAIVPGWCFIDGTCYAAGMNAPFNRCQACDPSADQGSWSNEPDGTPCPAAGGDCGVCCGSSCLSEESTSNCGGCGTICAAPFPTCVCSGACACMCS